MAGLMSRNKGKSGERELAGLIRDLTGWDAQRKVRQHGGDSDLEGIPGWSVEVKRHAAAPKSAIAMWWAQTVRQSNGLLPVLFYRADRADWRAVWPLAVTLKIQNADMWVDLEWACETSVAAWACVAREAVADLDAWKVEVMA